jgi:hypothetical protein
MFFQFFSFNMRRSRSLEVNYLEFFFCLLLFGFDLNHTRFNVFLLSDSRLENRDLKEISLNLIINMRLDAKNSRIKLRRKLSLSNSNKSILIID